MTIAEFSRRIELHFWDLAIPAISASPLLQRGIKAIYQLKRKTRPYRWYILGTSVAVIGFANGMLVYGILTR